MKLNSISTRNTFSNATIYLLFMELIDFLPDFLFLKSQTQKLIHQIKLKVTKVIIYLPKVKI